LATAAVSRGTGGLSHRRRLDVSRSTEKLTAPRRPSSPATLRVVRAAAEAKESFHNINETLSQLEANAERFENDLLRSSATMAAMDAARREREDAATAALLRRARDARARAPRRRTRRRWRRDASWRNARVKSEGNFEGSLELARAIVFHYDMS
jgi:predicted phage-related endonuclease